MPETILEALREPEIFGGFPFVLDLDIEKNSVFQGRNGRLFYFDEIKIRQILGQLG